MVAAAWSASANGACPCPCVPREGRRRRPTRRVARQASWPKPVERGFDAGYRVFSGTFTFSITPSRPGFQQYTLSAPRRRSEAISAAADADPAADPLAVDPAFIRLLTLPPRLGGLGLSSLDAIAALTAPPGSSAWSAGSPLRAAGAGVVRTRLAAWMAAVAPLLPEDGPGGPGSEGAAHLVVSRPLATLSGSAGGHARRCDAAATLLRHGAARSLLPLLSEARPGGGPLSCRGEALERRLDALVRFLCRAGLADATAGASVLGGGTGAESNPPARRGRRRMMSACAGTGDDDDGGGGGDDGEEVLSGGGFVPRDPAPRYPDLPPAAARGAVALVRRNPRLLAASVDERLSVNACWLIDRLGVDPVRASGEREIPRRRQRRRRRRRKRRRQRRRRGRRRRQRPGPRQRDRDGETASPRPLPSHPRPQIRNHPEVLQLSIEPGSPVRRKGAFLRGLNLPCRLWDPELLKASLERRLGPRLLLMSGRLDGKGGVVGGWPTAEPPGEEGAPVGGGRGEGGDGGEDGEGVGVGVGDGDGDHDGDGGDADAWWSAPGAPRPGALMAASDAVFARRALPPRGHRPELWPLLAAELGEALRVGEEGPSAAEVRAERGVPAAPTPDEAAAWLAARGADGEARAAPVR